jgi:predicted MFS family arabinose efflux permease
MSAAPKLRLAFFIWFIAALYYAYEFFLRISPQVMIPELTATFNINAAMIGWLSAFYYYAYASLQIPAGLLLDRFGVRKLLSVSALIVALSTFMLSKTDSLTVVLAARVLIGAGSAMAFISCLKIARAWFPPTMVPFIIGITNTLGVMGAIIGAAPLAYFVAHTGWRESFWIAGWTGLILAVAILLFVKSPPCSTQCFKDDRKQFLQELKQVFREKNTWLIAVIAALMVAPVSAFTELWSVPFLMQMHQITRESAALLSSIMFIGIAIGGPFYGLMTRFISTTMALKIGVSIAFLSLLSIIYLPLHSIFLLSFFLFCFGFSTASMLLCFALNAQIHRFSQTGVAVGLTNTLVMGGGALFQPLIGFLLDKGADSHFMNISNAGFQHALSILLLCQLIAFYCIHRLHYVKPT